MKTKFILLGLVFALFLGAGVLQQASAQQIPVPTQYLYGPVLYNPAAKGTQPGSNIFVSHQQRRIAFNAQSFTQLLSFSSAPLTANRVLAWGVNLTNDREYTERRTGISAVISYHLINQGNSSELGEERTRLSAGASMGMIVWGTDYTSLPLTDPADPLFTNQTTVAADAGLGLDFLMGRSNYQLQAGATFTQLPAAFYNEDNYTFTPVPHMLLSASGLFRLSDAIWAGPSVLFKEGLASENGSFGGGQLDVNGKIALPEKHIWAGVGYRLTTAGLNAAYGMRVLNTSATHLDFNLIAEVPMNSSRSFGPSLDVGVTFGWGGE